VLSRKVWLRGLDSKGLLTPEENSSWLERQAESFDKVGSDLNQALWSESEDFAKSLETHAFQVLSGFDADLGGGGYYSMLYFITRLLKPEVIVETGVAAGFTSSAFLTAIRQNKKGTLFSSDFPYFRLRNPEQYIGVVVTENLKNDWRLLIEGDQKNLPKILNQISHVDLFHYDSDKTYAGRQFAIMQLTPKLTSGSIIVMDDIQDNSFFHDWATNSGRPWRVYGWHSKYVGIVGELNRPTT
jgi:predicted O-methyltransferase YrrM